MKSVGYIRGSVANHQDYYVFRDVHEQSEKELNVACCTTANKPAFDSWDLGKIEFRQYQNLQELWKFDILDTSEFYRDYSQEIIENFPGKKVVTVFDNLPFGIAEGNCGKLSTEVDHIIARSPMIKRMLELEGVQASKISVVPSAVDTELFKPGIFRGSTPQVLFVGRIVPEKGLWDLIIAMSGLNIDLQVVGDGDTEPYRKLAAKCQVNVKFLGEVRHESLPGLMHQSSILAVPSIPKIDVYNVQSSWVEQFGVIIIEGMASGLPVIVSDTGSTRDIISDGDNGYLFPPRSWDILRYKIKELCSNYALRNKMGISGRERAKTLFSTQVVGKQLARIYTEL